MNWLYRLLGAVSLGFSHPVLSTDLHITTGFTPPLSDFYYQVLSEAARRMGDVSVNFEVLPAERSVDLVSKGVNDGECCRIPAVINKVYDNVSFCSESFVSVRFNAFAKDADLPIKSFADLKPYSVGTVRGWKIAVIKVHEVEPAIEMVVTSPEQLFEMLDGGRVDVGVMAYASGLKAISDLGLNGIHALEPALLEVPLYLMLAAKHAALVPRFDEAVRKMKQDGTVERLYMEMINSLGERGGRREGK